MAELNWRVAARALIVDDATGDVLLVRFEFPAATVWATPGGGLERDESPTDCLRRELREELGLVEVTVGPPLWTREHRIPMTTGHDGQRDTTYLVRIERFDPAPEIGWEQLLAEHVHEIKWWSVDEIVAATGDHHEQLRPDTDRPTVFAPRRLGQLVVDLHANGPPSLPVDAGI
ncbi:MAG TPA: NUDIX domain-containing protein [Ilumatobacter sp.]|nr:NUDIX domain-containing protein [Ilumatobacter sp.]